MTIQLGDRVLRHAVDEAIYLVLGGVREAAMRMGVSTQAVYQLLGAEEIRNRDTALKVAAATRDAGCEVPAAELMALVPWQGPARHPDPEGRKRPKGNARSSRPQVAQLVRPAEPAGAPALSSRRRPARAKGTMPGRACSSRARTRNAA